MCREWRLETSALSLDEWKGEGVLQGKDLRAWCFTCRRVRLPSLWLSTSLGCEVLVSGQGNLWRWRLWILLNHWALVLAVRYGLGYGDDVPFGMMMWQTESKDQKMKEMVNPLPQHRHRRPVGLPSVDVQLSAPHWQTQHHPHRSEMLQMSSDTMALPSCQSERRVKSKMVEPTLSNNLFWRGEGLRWKQSDGDETHLRECGPDSWHAHPHAHRPCALS